eukprot:evm.model.scf_1116.2 EVM.evm.TU.scf_1116.2   scf_1116:15222-17869(-)
MRRFGSLRKPAWHASVAWCSCRTAAERRATLSDMSSGGTPAFVFDMDGVLLRGKIPIPGASSALCALYHPNGLTPRFPVCLLTNSGGVTEEMRAKQLSASLGVKITSSQVVLSHTPMRKLAMQDLGCRPVLVCGRGNSEKVAKEYGFKVTITTEQLARALPSATPFSAIPGLEEGLDLCSPYQDGVGREGNPIRAVLVFTDPADWARDLQLITDVVMSGGIPGRKRPQEYSPVKVFFSHADLLWANDFPTPRFGQGAFVCALQALYKQTTGVPLPNVTFFGKPHPSQYRLVEEVLEHQAAELRLPRPIRTIYAVGDNPASDVRGANMAGGPWVSVLVRTGVFQKLGQNDKHDPALIVADNIMDFLQPVMMSA